MDALFKEQIPASAEIQNSVFCLIPSQPSKTSGSKAADSSDNKKPRQLPLQIGENSSVANCTVGHNCRIGANVDLENCVVCDNVVIADGTSVTDGCFLGPGVVLGADETLMGNLIVFDRAFLETVKGKAVFAPPPRDGGGAGASSSSSSKTKSLALSESGKVRFVEDVDFETDESGGNVVLDLGFYGKRATAAGEMLGDGACLDDEEEEEGNNNDCLTAKKVWGEWKVLMEFLDFHLMLIIIQVTTTADH